MTDKDPLDILLRDHMAPLPPASKNHEEIMMQRFADEEKKRSPKWSWISLSAVALLASTAAVVLFLTKQSVPILEEDAPDPIAEAIDTYSHLVMDDEPVYETFTVSLLY